MIGLPSGQVEPLRGGHVCPTRLRGRKKCYGGPCGACTSEHPAIIIFPEDFAFLKGNMNCPLILLHRSLPSHRRCRCRREPVDGLFPSSAARLFPQAKGLSFDYVNKQLLYQKCLYFVRFTIKKINSSTKLTHIFFSISSTKINWCYWLCLFLKRDWKLRKTTRAKQIFKNVNNWIAVFFWKEWGRP